MHGEKKEGLSYNYASSLGKLWDKRRRKPYETNQQQKKTCDLMSKQRGGGTDFRGKQMVTPLSGDSPWGLWRKIVSKERGAGEDPKKIKSNAVKGKRVIHLDDFGGSQKKKKKIFMYSYIW